MFARINIKLILNIAMWNFSLFVYENTNELNSHVWKEKTDEKACVGLLESQKPVCLRTVRKRWVVKPFMCVNLWQKKYFKEHFICNTALRDVFCRQPFSVTFYNKQIFQHFLMEIFCLHIWNFAFVPFNLHIKSSEKLSWKKLTSTRC